MGQSKDINFARTFSKVKVIKKMQPPKQNIKNDIWITQKSRMNSEKRLQRYNSYLNFLIVYYAFFLICLSVYRLSEVSLGVAASAELVLSIGVFSLSVFTFASNFNGRAAKYRECYLRLGKLSASQKTNQEIEDEYHEILAGYENHEERDYLRLVIDRKLLRKKEITGSSGETITLSNWGYVKYALSYLGLNFVAIILLLIPLILIFRTNIMGAFCEC